MEDEIRAIRELRKAVNSATALVYSCACCIIQTNSFTFTPPRPRSCKWTHIRLGSHDTHTHTHTHTPFFQMVAIENDLNDLGDNYTKLAQVNASTILPA
jgi:hypothetical protein